MTINSYALLAIGFTIAAGCTKPVITSTTSAVGEVSKPFTYQIVGTGKPTTFGATVPPPAGLTVDGTTGLISGTPAESGEFDVLITAQNNVGSGSQTLSLKIADNGVPLGPPHSVKKEKELFITDPLVIGSDRAKQNGPWHIRSIMQRVAGPGRNVDEFADRWIATWGANTSVPGSTEQFKARAQTMAALRAAWRENRIRLIAIVNRSDLARFPDNDRTKPPVALGESRFVYEIVGNPQGPFSIIFEFKLPPDSSPALSLRNWARRWHSLGRDELGTESEFPEGYLAELQQVTDLFSTHGNLGQIRTNEFVQRPWELREFHFDSATGSLQQVPVVLTPAIANFPVSATLAAFVVANEAEILKGNLSEYPPALRAAVAPIPSDSATPVFTWKNIAAPPRAMFATSFNTCNGCHAADTGTKFQHIGERAPNKSAFLTTEITLAQPLPGSSTTKHDEMAQRVAILADFAGDPTGKNSKARSGASIDEFVRSRANRSH